MVEYMKTYGPALIANGYPITEIIPGTKRVGRTGWQTHPLTLEELAPFARYGIGILCGLPGSAICGIDLDLPDPDVVAKVEEQLEGIFEEKVLCMPKRVGKAPKALYICRAEKPGWAKRTSAVYVKNGVKCQAEILGRGQQFVAYGVHPDTGLPYTQTSLVGDGGFALPLDKTKLEDLPVVTEAEIGALLSLVEQVLEDSGYEQLAPASRQLSGVPSEVPEELSLSDIKCPDVSLAKAERIIREIKPDLGKGSYDTWLKYGMALHNQFDGSLEALELWKRVSLEFGPESYSSDGCDQKWASFGKSGGNQISFRWVLKVWRTATDPECMRLDYVGLTRRMLRDYGDCLAFLPDINSWVGFSAKTRKWSLVRGEALAHEYLLDQVVLRGLKEEAEQEPGEDRKAEILKFRNRLCSTVGTTTTTVLREVRLTPSALRSRSDFDSNPEYFACDNGVVHLPTGRLLPETPDMMCLRHSGVRFDPTARCPTWRRAIRQILGSEDAVRFFQRGMGAALSGRLKDNLLFLLRGLGKNGKTVVLETMAKVFGGYAESLMESTLLGCNSGFDDGGKPRADLAKLAGARLVYVSETTENARLREADVKRMTGGDGVVARAPYGKYEMRIPQTWRLVLVTNHLPRVLGQDGGIWRRFADLVCPNAFGPKGDYPEDPRLLEKLERELPGILNWLLEGYLEYSMLPRFELTPEVAAAVAEYRKEQDDVGNWVANHLAGEPDSKKFLTGSQLFAAYRDQMARECEVSRLTQRQFLLRIGNMYRSKNLRPDAIWRKSTGNVWRLYGYRLRTAEEFESEPDLASSGA